MSIPTIEDYALPLVAPAAQQVDWTLDPQRCALLVHDMQAFFLRPFAKNSLLPGLLGNSQEILAAARNAGLPIYYTGQPGSMTPEQRGLLADFWGPGMRADEADRSFAADLAPRSGDSVLTKWRYSAFYDTELRADLARQGRDQLLIVGVYAHVGILATAVDAMSHGVRPFVAVDAVADFSAAEHRLAVDYIARRCGRAVTTRDAVSALEGADRRVSA